MRKILLLSSLLVVFMFVVSCAPQLTDEELEAELAKLTPEQQAELLADLEAKESGAFAGKAIASTYSSKLTYATVGQIQMLLLCTDTDGGQNEFKYGAATGTVGTVKETLVDECEVTLAFGTGSTKPIRTMLVESCNQYPVGSTVPAFSSLGAVSKIDGCKVYEAICDPNLKEGTTSWPPVRKKITCSYGCNQGACLTQ